MKPTRVSNFNDNELNSSQLGEISLLNFVDQDSPKEVAVDSGFLKYLQSEEVDQTGKIKLNKVPSSTRPRVGSVLSRKSDNRPSLLNKKLKRLDTLQQSRQRDMGSIKLKKQPNSATVKFKRS